MSKSYDWILMKISEPRVKMFKFWCSLFQRDFESVTDFVHKVSLLYLEGAGDCESVIHCVDVFCSLGNPGILYYFFYISVK